MNWLMQFLGGPIIEKLLSFIPDPNERARQQFELQKALLDAANQAEADQRAINKQEAASSSVFVSGWRPFIGWVCGSAVAYEYILVPLASWITAASGSAMPPLPGLDGRLWELVMALLGMGTLRTIERVKGVARI